ncbi:hypothetical protein MMC19_001228 [Ptychographa xylographoides]|nr:hypothetical protein [Ptychographa xylographoides]
MVSALLIVAVIVTALAGIAAAAYMFTDAGKDIAEWAAERFFKAKARAEEKALEKAGSDEMQGFLKDQLKKNPVVSNDELNQIQSGLGDEAMKEFGGGQGGLGAMLGGIGGKN